MSESKEDRVAVIEQHITKLFDEIKQANRDGFLQDVSIDTPAMMTGVSPDGTCEYARTGEKIISFTIFPLSPRTI
jgi:hypothetical protein